MMTAKRRFTDEEREQRRAQDRQRLKVASEQLLTSEGWQRWVRVRARGGLARLSLNNQLLVALACPDATFVAGFKAWLQLGYCPVKGSKAIRIMAPMPVRERVSQAGEKTDETRVLFKAVSVFDRVQVAAIDGVEQAPLEPPCEPLTGDSHAHLLDSLAVFARSLGFTVSFEEIPGSAGGWCDAKRKRIVVDAAAPANARVRTLVHETIHALGVGYAEFGRERAEVIVDTATYLVCGGLGLDVGGESVPYVAGWGEDGALEAVTQFAKMIDELAHRVEAALTSNDDQQLAAA
jgi:hypothetical protein